jgi:hypothetical protein
MTKRLEQDIDAINMEEVEAYSMALGLLLRFIQAVVKLRIADVANRRYLFAKASQERENAIQASEELAKKR